MVPDKVHLVGSIALDSVDEVFQTLGSTLGNRLRRVPDGEPGGRRLWISWQYPLLRAQPFLKADPEAPIKPRAFCRYPSRMMSSRRKCDLANWVTRERLARLTRIFSRHDGAATCPRR